MMEHVDHVGLHLDADGVIRCFARTHGGSDHIVIDLAAERKATVERIRAALEHRFSFLLAMGGTIGAADILAILDAEAAR